MVVRMRLDRAASAIKAILATLAALILLALCGSFILGCDLLILSHCAAKPYSDLDKFRVALNQVVTVCYGNHVMCVPDI
jgi:hypothetical protein